MSRSPGSDRHRHRCGCFIGDDLSSFFCPLGDLCGCLTNSLQRTCGPTVCILCDSGENNSMERLIRHSSSIYSARPITSVRFRKSSSLCRARRILIFNNLAPIKIDAGKANILMAVRKSTIDSTPCSDFHRPSLLPAHPSQLLIWPKGWVLSHIG